MENPSKGQTVDIPIRRSRFNGFEVRRKPREPQRDGNRLFGQPNSTYGPSILVDMEEGRTTEGEHTIGDLVERAVGRGIGVPILTAARCNLQAYEINRAAGTRVQ